MSLIETIKSLLEGLISVFHNPLNVEVVILLQRAKSILDPIYVMNYVTQIQAVFSEKYKVQMERRENFREIKKEESHEQKVFKRGPRQEKLLKTKSILENINYTITIQNFAENPNQNIIVIPLLLIIRPEDGNKIVENVQINFDANEIQMTTTMRVLLISDPQQFLDWSSGRASLTLNPFEVRNAVHVSKPEGKDVLTIKGFENDKNSVRVTQNFICFVRATNENEKFPNKIAISIDLSGE